MIRRKKLLMKIKTCAMVTVLALACTNAFAFKDRYTNRSYNGAYKVNGNRWIGSLYITVKGDVKVVTYCAPILLMMTRQIFGHVTYN